MVFKIMVEFSIIGIQPVKKTDVSSLIIRIFAYSAMKIKANMPPLYSTLNPETSSDSPSAKSNGVRFVSAKFVMNQNINITIIISDGQDNMLVDINEMSIFLWIISAQIRINDIDTSYEIVWATPRRAPSRAYLELEHQPARNVAYTFILDTHKKYRIPNLKYIAVFECG